MNAAASSHRCNVPGAVEAVAELSTDYLVLVVVVVVVVVKLNSCERDKLSAEFSANSVRVLLPLLLLLWSLRTHLRSHCAGVY